MHKLDYDHQKCRGKALLRLQSIKKQFAGKTVVDNLTFDIRPGEFFSLLGPSGCGKTTLLRLIGGQERCDSGSIILNGRDLTDLPPAARPLHMIFQNLALFPHLDVAGNIAFGLKLRNIPSAEIKSMVAQVLEQVALSGFEKRSIHTLSGGQKQRVAIARAVVNKPQLLLLDEPLSALDQKLREKMQIELRSLQQSLGMTFIFVTHAQDEALSLSDRIAVMNNGTIEQIGTPEEVYQRPKTPFVATFIGSANALYRENAGGVETVLMRPERVRISPYASGDASDLEAESKARVTRVVFRGSYREVHAKLEAGLGHATADWLVHAPLASSAFAEGDLVRLQWQRSDEVIMPGRVVP